MRPINEKVVLGYVHPGTVHGFFAECVMDLMQYDFCTNKRIVDGGGRLSFRASANLSAPRNMVVRKFLEYGKADWLWMLDTDMTFKPDSLERLLDSADPEKAPIVGGLCFGFDENGEIQPTLYGLAGEADDPVVIRYHDWVPNSMYQVAATGAACLLVHKSVFEKMRDFEHPNGGRGFNPAFPWFQELSHDNRPVSEDIAFCWRAGLMGIPVYVNTAVDLGHVKDQILTKETYLFARELTATEEQS